MVFTATAAILLDGEGFNRLVAEEDLRTWQQGAYLYTKRQGKSGIEIYRTASILWDAIPITSGATADPAAGASWAVITVPVGKRWVIQALSSSIVADANAANRYVKIVISDGTNTIAQYIDSTAHTANLTVQHSFVAGAAASGSVSYGLVVPIGLMELTAGSTITCTIVNIQVGDNAGVMAYSYKEAPL